MNEAKKINLTESHEKLVEIPTQDFPPITPEDLKQITDLADKLMVKFYSGDESKHSLPGFEKYTGIGATVGIYEGHYNSVVTARQLRFAMAMSRHPILYEIIKSPKISRINFDADILIKNKIMAKLRILDLGSGVPIFARCARQMGADVWTVDIGAITNDLLKDSLPEDYKRLEIAQHLTLNLWDKDSEAKIKLATGGNFNLVTEASLKADGFTNGRKIAMQLLKQGGIYFDSPRGPEIKL